MKYVLIALVAAIVIAVIILVALLSSFRPPSSAGPASAARKPKTETLTLIDEQCNQTLTVPANASYRGLLTDTHIHTNPGEDQAAYALALLKEMNSAGIERVLVQPSHDPSGDKTRAQSVDRDWGEIAKRCDRLIPLLYGFNPDSASAVDYVRERLETGRYGGIGEIEFQHGHFTNLKTDPESASMAAIYQLLEERGLVIHFQAATNVDPGLQPKLERVIRAHPKLNFLWFGCPFGKPWSELANLYCNQFVHSESRGFSAVTPPQALIGSDAAPAGFANPAKGLLPYDNVAGSAQVARETLSQFPTPLADQVASGNFNKLWPKQSPP